MVLVTRQGCHLCEQAAATIAAHLPSEQLTTLDVDTDPALRERFTDHVPVVFLDGRLFAYWTLDAEALHAALSGKGWNSPPGL